MTNSSGRPAMGNDRSDAPAVDQEGMVEYAQLISPHGLEESGSFVVTTTFADHDRIKKEEGGIDDGSFSRAKNEDKQTPPEFPFSELYRYATPMDRVYLVLGMLCAGANGALFPCMALVLGDAITAFQQPGGGVDRGVINTAALHYLFIALGLFFTDLVAHILFSATAERQVAALRAELLQHMLYMDIGWYDSNDSLQLSSRLTGDTVKIKDGMGQKLGDTFKYACQFFSGFIISFTKGWDMTLVMFCVVPIMTGSLVFMFKVFRLTTEVSQKLYAEAGAVAEETLGSIRTVASLTNERRAIDKFNRKSRVAETETIRMAKSSAAVYGLFQSSIWIMFAVGMWYGGSRVVSDEATPGDVFSGFFGVMMGTVALAQSLPNIGAIAQARGAAQVLFQILDTPSPIDASKPGGITPDSCAGAIEAINVEFTYPSRPDVLILNGYNVKIEAGQTVAFVGASGGGKSTLINLLERFYDPQAGQILLDGRDIKTLNLSWLRSQIGMVSQEPVLFARTIYENIAAGGEGITRERAVEAAKKANAHDFIMSLPQQYDTLVGEKGASLSGGQKQRVAIARALVRNPKILVLDEATSALDTESERIVQDALNDLMRETKMTTLVIAHRLSTIRHADKIVVLADGRVVEEGRHEELLTIGDGVYTKLYTIQDQKAKEEADATVVELVDLEDDGGARKMQRAISLCSSKSLFDGRGAFDDDAELVPQQRFGLMDVLALCRPERKYFVLGAISAVVCGASVPGSAVLVSELMATMNLKYANYHNSGDHGYLDDLSHEITIYGICYLCGAVVLFTFSAFQSYAFRFIAEKLTTRLRDMHFTALCRQNIAFFDETKNATGALTSDLSTNATKVAMISGESLGRVVQAAFTFIVAVVISFSTGSWLLTLIMLAVFPFLMLGQMIRMRHIRSGGASASGLSDELAEVGAHASEAFGNIRTVVSLGLEKWTASDFNRLLEAPLADGRREGRINGAAIGFSSFIIFSTYSLVFWYGGILVDHGDITFLQVVRTLMAIMMSAQRVGDAATFFSESDKAQKSGAAIMAIRDRPLPIDSFDEGGERPATVEGKLEFKNITFRYPTRPGVTVLKNYNLTIEAGQTVAFCGPSGGGKSTCVSMIERFYDPVQGQVTLDGRDLKTLNVQWLRSQIGLVGQEPTLFIGTIAENIAFGLVKQPTQEEIESAAKMANAHDFITRFPDGYDTQVGAKGEQLSGGQKQRIAIARAILKNPNILLLDEATSALDTESEQIVQEALDKVVALKRRTTVIIAHRLSTIRKADKICVVSGGHIAEQGTHLELLAMNGTYRKLVESATT